MTNVEQCDITVGFDSDQLDLIRRAACICEQSVAAFVIDAALEQAIETVFDGKVTFLSDAAYEAFIAANFRSDR